MPTDSRPTDLTDDLTDDQALAALDRLVAAFGSGDTEGYFACMAADATFTFHTEPRTLASRAAYRALWDGWLRAGWRVLTCESTERVVTRRGRVAVLTHRVRTTVEVDGAAEHLDERETVVVARDDDGEVRVVHEHLSSTPAPQTSPES